MSTTPSPILLRLDPRALAALFPEGTQARADLQQAVIAEFVRKNLRPDALGGDVRDQIERARADALSAVNGAKYEVASKVIQELGAVRGAWGKLEIKGDMKDAVAEAARQAVRDEISKAVALHVEAATEKLRSTVAHDAQAAINRLIDSEIRAAVKARVAAVVEKISTGVL